MATRLHVAAARSMSRDDFEAAFARHFGERWEGVGITSEGGWHWFTASVWGVGGGELDAVLATFPGPALRVTTEDGCRWYLILHAQGQEPYVLSHEFTALRASAGEDESDEAEDLLAFLRDEDSDNLQPLPKPSEEIAERFADLGRPLPDDLVASLEGLGYGRIQRVLQQHFAEATADALGRFGVPHDGDEVIGCLTGATVDEREYHHDVGNLPRFLVALGFGGDWQRTLEAQLAPPTDGPEVCEPPPRPDPRARVDAILTRAGEMTPVPVPGGPAVVPLAQAVHVASIAWYCGEWIGAVWALELPAGADGSVNLQSSGEMHVVAEACHVLIGEESVIPSHPHIDRSALSAAFEALPDGTRIDLVTVGHEPIDAKAEAARMRFRGTVRGGAWQIEEAWPEAPCEAIRGAVDLTVAVEAGQGLMARDEEEAAAIAEGAARHPMLDHRGTRREGLLFTRDSWAERYLALVIFRLRYARIWNTKPFEEEDDEMFEEWSETESALAAPHAEEVLLDGRAARFYAADLRQLAKLDRDALAQAEEGMRAIGLEPVGDVCCDRAEAVVVRGYGAQGSLWWGAHMQAIDGQAYTEFVTRFADGSHLTTCNNPNAESFPDSALYSRVYEGANVAQLQARHVDGMERLANHRGTVPAVIEPTLLGLARAMDDYFLSRGEPPGFVTRTLA